MPQDDHHAPATTPLTLDDLRESGYDTILADESTGEYSILDGLLGGAARAADAAGEQEKGRALAFLARICSMMLTPTELAAPFQPVIRFSDGRRSMIAEDLTVTDIELLAGLAPEVANAALRARLADLVWLKARKKGIAFVRMAIDAYREHPIDADTWHMGGADAWHRALQLAVLVGAGAEHRATEIESTLLDAFWRSVNADDYEPLWYVRPLYAIGAATGQAARIAAQFATTGGKRLDAGRALEAEPFFSAAERWYARAGLAAERADMLALAASCWAAQAELGGSAIARHHYYDKAISAYREVPAAFRPIHNVDAKISQLRTALASAAQLLLAEMIPVRGPSVDLADIADVAIKRVQGKAPVDALRAFCTLHPLPNLAQHLAAAEVLVGESTIGGLFSTTTIASDGRAIARREGADGGDAARAARVHAESIKTCLMTMAMTTRGMIFPALDAMQLEVHYTQRDFFELAHYSPLVPRDRIEIVAKGLYAGYCRDYIQAVHLLLPQFEHMVRQALKAAGTHTTTLDSDSIDLEVGLSTLVDRPKMEELFGRDLTFTIRALMCDQEGPNLRNAVAHGLANNSTCESDYGVYAWWLILSLVAEAFIVMRSNADDSQ